MRGTRDQSSDNKHETVVAPGTQHWLRSASYQPVLTGSACAVWQAGIGAQPIKKGRADAGRWRGPRCDRHTAETGRHQQLVCTGTGSWAAAAPSRPSGRPHPHRSDAASLTGRRETPAHAEGKKAVAERHRACLAVAIHRLRSHRCLGGLRHGGADRSPLTRDGGPGTPGPGIHGARRDSESGFCAWKRPSPCAMERETCREWSAGRARRDRRCWARGFMIATHAIIL